MSSAAVAVDVRPSLRQRFACANVASLGIQGKSKDAIESAAARGDVVTLPDGTPALLVDGRIVGAIPDDRSVARDFSRLTSNDRTLVVVFGLGVGHAVREIRERTTAPIIVFDPDPGIVRTVLEHGPSDLGGTTIVTDLADLAGQWPHLARFYACASLVVTPGYPALFPEALEALRETIPRLVADVDVTENTRVARFREWIGHNLENLHVLERTTPVVALGRLLEGVPAFIVGAGPSLAKNGAELRLAAKKGVIIAVDVSARALAKMGIEPDVVVCLEGMSLGKQLAALPFIDDVIRCFSLSAHPENLAAGNGPLLPFYERIPQFAPIEELCGAPGASVGGSVSTVAFSIAERLGCSPIVLVGQDLAYSNGLTHAPGTPFEKSRVAIDENTGKVKFEWCAAMADFRGKSTLGKAPPTDDLFMVEGYGGGAKVASTSSFNSFRIWFEVAAQTLAESRKELVLVNATEGGSRIAGYLERPLAQLLAELSDLAVDARAILRGANRPHRTREELDAWRGELVAKTANVRRIAARLEAACARAERRLGDGVNVTRQFARLDELELQLRAAIRSQPLLDAWSHARIRPLTERDTRAHATDTRDDAKWALEAERKFASTLVQCARELEAAVRASSIHEHQSLAASRGTTQSTTPNEAST